MTVVTNAYLVPNVVAISQASYNDYKGARKNEVVSWVFPFGGSGTGRVARDRIGGDALRARPSCCHGT